MYDQAYRYLEIYYNEARAKLPFNNYDEFIQHYRIDHFLLEYYNDLFIHDDFLEQFNKALEVVTSHDDKVTAMKSLASKTLSGKTPKNDTFFDALSGQVEKFTFEDAVNVAKESGEKIVDTGKKVAVAGVSLWIIKGIAGFVLVELLKSMMAKK